METPVQSSSWQQPGASRRPGLRSLIYSYDIPLFIMLRHWLNPRNPVFRSVATRPMPVPSLEGTIFTSRRVRQIIRTVTDWSSALGCLLMPLFFIGPFLPWLWRLPTLISTGPLVAGEIEGRTWFTLRSTPYSTKEIIQGLHAGGVYRTAFMWAYVSSMRLAVVGLLAMIMLILSWAPARDRLDVTFIEWVAYLLCALYFLLEPLLDIAIDGMVGLLGSTFARNQLMGVVNAVLLRVVLWGLQIMTLMFVMPLANETLAPKVAGSAPALVLLGPAYALTLGFSAEAAIMMIVGLTVARLLFLQFLTAVTAWRAEIVQE
ncbi:MAG: hypothetical protein JXB47_00490 [Anaerolineae bacterium]|nr:hypothetical protein [Anaerolineae bacterium]